MGKNKVEVDCIIENSKDNYFVIEVKANAALTPEDFIRLKRFKQVANKRFECGVLLRHGDYTTVFCNDILAVRHWRIMKLKVDVKGDMIFLQSK